MQRCKQRTCPRGAQAALGAATFGAVLIASLLGAPQVRADTGARAAGCITRLPVQATIPTEFAAAYTDTIPLNVTTKGPRIRSGRAALYTFSGAKLASGRAHGAIAGTKVIDMRLKSAMEAGKFTLLVTGEPNRGRHCGPKTFKEILEFKKCDSTLPIGFPSPLGGKASDYGGTLSVPVMAQGPVIRGLHGSVSSFGGQLFGQVDLDVLFGETTLNLTLTTPLVPGNYTVFVTGDSGKPAACGQESAKLVVALK